MATLELQLPASTEPHLSYKTQLDGVVFRLTWDWVERLGLWQLAVADSVDEPLIAGVAVTANWVLNHSLRASSGIRGFLYLYTSDGLDPTIDTIQNATLFYVEEADLPA
jgi:hypothetical protein